MVLIDVNANGFIKQFIYQKYGFIFIV